MAMSVVAQYKYSYQYEGKMISFTKGERFKLVSKANTDWWQVQRCLDDGSLETIYVPANYMKLEEETRPDESHYANIMDFKMEYQKAKEEMAKQQKSMPEKQNPLDVSPKPMKRLSPKVTRTKSNTIIEDLNRVSDVQSQNGHLPLERTQNKPKRKSSEPMVSPTEVRNIWGHGVESSGMKDTGPSDQRKQLESLLNKQLSGGGLVSAPPTANAAASSLGVPAPKPKPRKADRPGSYYYDNEEGIDSSTFKSCRPEAVSPGDESFKKTFDNFGKADGGSKPKNIQVPNTVGTSSSAPTTPSVLSTPPLSLPMGWSEHKTADGCVYYYNATTKESKWTRPGGSSQAGSHDGSSPKTKPKSKKSEEMVAPRGWTKEINPLTQTPVYTNSRTLEKWSLASDDQGYFYYNMSNSSMTLRQLPPLDDFAQAVPCPAAPKRAVSDSTHSSTSIGHLPSESKDLTLSADAVELRPNSQQLSLISQHRMSMVLNKHGYLQKKRVADANRKLRSEKWVKIFAVLQGNQLMFYNDHRRDQSGAKPLGEFSLLQAQICPLNKDKKRFQMSFPFGEIFQIQADTPQMMNDWYSTIQTAIDQTNEDCKKNPERYSDLVSSLGSGDSPPTSSKVPHKNKGIDEEDLEEIEGLSGADKTVRIKGRLKNLIARRPQAETLKKTGIIQVNIFGSKLSELAEKTHRLVPEFLEHFIAHIEKKGLSVVGIYRLSGNAAQVQKLRYCVEEDPLVDLTAPEWADINIVTGCLKLYFRELPDPLIPFKQFHNFIDAARVSPPEKRTAMLAAEISRLPEANYQTLKVLTTHLTNIVQNNAVNKMQASNCGIVFGPTLMRPEIDSIEMAMLMPVQNGLVETFITDYRSLFRK